MSYDATDTVIAGLMSGAFAFLAAFCFSLPSHPVIAIVGGVLHAASAAVCFSVFLRSVW